MRPREVATIEARFGYQFMEVIEKKLQPGLLARESKTGLAASDALVKF